MELVACLAAANFYVNRFRLTANKYVDTRMGAGNSDESMASRFRGFIINGCLTPVVIRRQTTVDACSTILTGCGVL